MENNKIIGGEFGIDLDVLQYGAANSLHFEDVYKYSSGRSALYYILLDLKSRFGINTVLFPDYLCSSLLFAAKQAQMTVKFYPLNESLQLDESGFSNVYDKNCAVLIINYFGLQNLSEDISFIKSLSSDAIIIEDDVQAFYKFIEGTESVNYKFTSLRKIFAIPDGGLVKTGYTMPKASESNKFYQYKLGGSILKKLRKPEYYDDEVYLSMFEKGEHMIDNEILLGMSEISQELISKADIERIRIIRKNNVKTIMNGLNSIGIKTILPIPDNSVPLFIPIYLDDRDRVRKYMFQHNTFCPVHWPLEGMNIKKGAEMAKHEMSIIVDQRYTHQDMEYILDLLSKSI
jgi:hypothetical protein